jgi:uncharacterized protein YxeA
MKKTLIIITLIVMLGFLAAVYMWTSHNRYWLGCTNDAAYLLDKKTGNVWFLASYNKVQVRDYKPK